MSSNIENFKNIDRRNFLKLTGASGLAFLGMGLSACGATGASAKTGSAAGSANASKKKVTITNFSYDPTRELYAS